MPIVVLLFFSVISMYADITHKCANMIIIGIQGESIADDAKLATFIQKNALGGILLFGKNLKTKKQVKKLTSDFQKLHPDTLLIGIDQEGGFVDRLSHIKSIQPFPSAQKVSLMDDNRTQKIYTKMAKTTHELGFNLNFAPSVDLSINPKNRVIVHYQRSFGKDVAHVVHKASIFLDAFAKEDVLCAIKHFPGHGSSTGDSHKGFTDVTHSWQEKELKPFLDLIEMGKVPMIMSAHIFNTHLDQHYPATLSQKTLQQLLRKSMGYHGVIVSDDMQMGAITQNYTLKESISLAINAGVDMLLFGNQIGKPVSATQIVAIMKTLLAEGKITSKQIETANQRIEKLKNTLGH